MNKVTLIGHSGADAKVEYLPGANAMAVCKISMSTSEKDKKTDQWIPCWHRVTLFSKLAEQYGQRIKKGTKLYVEGKIQYREWTGKDGLKKNSVDIIAWSVFIIEKETQANGGRYSEGQSSDSFGNTEIPF